MIRFYVTFSVISFALLFCSLTATGEECRSGHVWISDCNTCFCVNGTTFCTEKACLDDAEKSLSIEAESLRSAAKEVTNAIIYNTNTQDCKHGSRWRKDCNWCTCINGTQSCSREECRKGSYEANGSYCEDGSQWTDDCNVCKCVGGLPMCAETPCSHSTRIKPAILTKNIKTKVMECKTGTIWKDGCNVCSCNDGVAKCIPGTCLQDGTEIEEAIYLLDSSLDSNDLSEEDEGGRVFCSKGSWWRRGCNWCYCDGGRQVCESKECLYDDENELDKMCVENSRWKEDCNWCMCANGQKVCSKQTCSSEKGISATPKISVCRANHSWTYDCNVCVCANSYFVCTKRVCSDQEEIKAGHCVREASWKEDCNDCLCHDGQKACSRRKCLPSGPSNDISGKQLDTASKSNAEGICKLNIESGPCEGSLPRYAYNTQMSRCEPFVYTGCQGNENNFLALEECRNQCEGTRNSDFQCPVIECPSDCSSTTDESSGCNYCNCTANTPECPSPVCWSSCVNPKIEFEESVGCYICRCECMKDNDGNPPCPLDCKSVIVFDEIIGCDACICDPDDPNNTIF